METENRETSPETDDDVDFIQENVQEQVTKPLVSKCLPFITRVIFTTVTISGLLSY